MATSPALLPIEEYLQNSYHPDADYVDGEIEHRTMGEHTHNFLEGFIYYAFTANQEFWGTEAIIEQRIRIDSSRVRVCDVAVIDASAPFEEVLTTPPLICIEVLSPGDRAARAEVVLADYLAMGVANIWFIDPVRRAAYTFGPAGLQEADPANLTVPNTPIHLDLTPAFAKLDRKTAPTVE
jgi:Uma2 family endonuclease